MKMHLEYPTPFYETRVKEFQGRLDSDPGFILKPHISNALSLTTKCMSQYVELAEVSKRVVNSLKSESEKTLNEFREIDEQCRKLLNGYYEILSNPNASEEQKQTSKEFTEFALQKTKSTRALI